MTHSEANVPVGDPWGLVEKPGFNERIRGDHHIFTKDGVPEIIKIQPKGSKTKVYQIKQIRGIFLKHKLGGQDVDTL